MDSEALFAWDIVNCECHFSLIPPKILHGMRLFLNCVLCLIHSLDSRGTCQLGFSPWWFALGGGLGIWIALRLIAFSVLSDSEDSTSLIISLWVRLFFSREQKKYTSLSLAKTMLLIPDWFQCAWFGFFLSSTIFLAQAKAWFSFFFCLPQNCLFFWQRSPGFLLKIFLPLEMLGVLRVNKSLVCSFFWASRLFWGFAKIYVGDVFPVVDLRFGKSLHFKIFVI